VLTNYSVSFKNTHETAQAINGMQLQRAVKYLENVREKKEAIPFRRYNGSMGRTGQGMWKSYHMACVCVCVVLEDLS